MSESLVVDLDIDQGADYAMQIYWTDAGSNPINIQHPMRMDIRNETGQIVQSLNTDMEGIDPPEIIFNSDSGLIQLTLTDEQTSMLPAGQYDYDLFVSYMDEASGAVRVRKLIRGNVFVSGRVTKEL